MLNDNTHMRDIEPVRSRPNIHLFKVKLLDNETLGDTASLRHRNTGCAE